MNANKGSRPEVSDQDCSGRPKDLCCPQARVDRRLAQGQLDFQNKPSTTTGIPRNPTSRSRFCRLARPQAHMTNVTGCSMAGSLPMSSPSEKLKKWVT